MSSQVNISDFSYTGGLNLGKDTQSLTYLYGLSDFWQLLFQDTSTTNLLVETTSVQASDIYSKFLQLCSGLSIADIADSASSQLQLQIIRSINDLPIDIPIVSGIWNNNFTTLRVSDNSQFVVGDTITVSGVKNLIVYDVGNGINTNPIATGGDSASSQGDDWNGTFTITSVLLNGYITYYQPVNPGLYTTGGAVSTTSIGVETYQLSGKVVSTRFIANKPFLPNIVLEEGVDYFISESTFRISFAQPLSSYGFPSRISSEGYTEYSLWFVDVRYDEDLMYEHFPKLLGRTHPRVSNEDYRNFLYGLFYIYTSGPTLSVIQKGLNLALGVPLARDEEVVLEIRPYLNTSQFIIITDLNSYIIPSGLTPAVSVDQLLSVGDELSKWIEIFDHQNYNEWWKTNTVEIPVEVMPHIPVGFSRAIASGNYADWMMVNYLKNNIFLVRINIPYDDFLGIQKFEDIPALLLELKPKHTYPVYLYRDSSLQTISSLEMVTSVGNTTVSISTALSGVSFTGIPGTMDRGLLLSSVSANTLVNTTPAANTTDISGEVSGFSIGDVSTAWNLSGNSVISSIGMSQHTLNGTWTLSGDVSLDGIYDVPAIGVFREVSISGVTATSAVNSPYTFALGLSGVSSNTSVDNIGAGSQLYGNITLGSSGVLTAYKSMSISGVTTNSNIGVFEVSSTNDITANILSSWIASPIVSQGITGVSGTGSVSSMSPSTDSGVTSVETLGFASNAKFINSVSSTSSVSSVTASRSVIMDNLSATGTTADLGAADSIIVSITAVSRTTSVGTLLDSCSVSTTAISSTTSVGTLLDSISVSTTAVSSTTSVGTVTAGIT